MTDDHRTEDVDADDRTEGERVDPPLRGAERPMLAGWLDFHRATLLTKCAGLSTAQLAERSVQPSGLSLLGLVRHLTLVERAWFSQAYDPDDNATILWGDDFARVAEADASADLAAFRAQLERSRLVAEAQPDLEAIGRGVRGGRPVEVSLRWIYLHMIEEYARHNGHADLLRERLDGTTGA